MEYIDRSEPWHEVRYGVQGSPRRVLREGVEDRGFRCETEEWTNYAQDGVQQNGEDSGYCQLALEKH